MNFRHLLLSSMIVAGSISGGCPGPSEPSPPVEDVYGPLGTAVPRATAEQLETFERGEAVALGRFTPESGLGPHFNVTFCGACHEKPVFGGAGGRYRNFLLVQQELSDGSAVPVGVNGVLPHFDERGRFETPEDANSFALRNPIPFFGVGLIAAIPESVILANADPDDLDGDGISGRPNIDRGFVGRFGRKSQTASIEGFIRGPLFNHLGVTSDPLSEELKARLPVPSNSEAVGGSRMGLSDGIGGRTDAQAAAPAEPTTDTDGVPDPEMPEQDLFDLVSWAMLLAAPEPEAPTESSEAGRELFLAANCAGCHVPSLEGPDGSVPLYSDLLLHDMGEALGDGFSFLDATGNEFRTQPLWGIVAAAPYMHDGRADTLDEAIRFHGGEAAAARDAYIAMTDAERGLLIEFLESLGGRDQTSEGLLPPGAEIPEVGTYGGPERALNETEQALFVEGRAIFDRDMFTTEGLGPVFNGDACRACHFDPVIGGSGPSDVDVTRHGIFEDGVFSAPAQGSMAHRHALGAERPRFSAMANLVERRQTPTILGMGLIDIIPEAMLLANADPEDMDGDGISGRAHRLPDGRVGRFGWKANVPSTAEFVRDAMSVELGMTLPDQAGLIFGVGADDDGVPDPEMTVGDLEAVAFFMNMLARPPSNGSSPEGETHFNAIGCVSCHSNFTLDDGQDVELYSDLLLHDVQSAGFMGASDGDANEREFRTPPLWGIRDTAPYMHDGRATTLEDAIAAHSAEAEASRIAYEALDGSARAALLEFVRTR